MSNVKNFCVKATEVTKKLTNNTKKCFQNTGNKIIDFMTPKRDYSNLSEEDANVMRKIDRAETIDNLCWFFSTSLIMWYLLHTVLSSQRISKVFLRSNNILYKRLLLCSLLFFMII